VLYSVINRIQSVSSQTASSQAQGQRPMEAKLTIPYKIGFLGIGNMAQAMIKGLLDGKVIAPHALYASNRSEGKLQKATELFGIHSCATNEALIEKTDVVILAMKPQDLPAAIDPISSLFNEGQIVISLVAGVTLQTLEKKLPQCRIVRVMPNTPSLIGRGVLGYVMNEADQGVQILVEDLFSPLGYVLQVDDEDQFEALTVSAASGPGFIFEMMMYWQEWIEERGFDPAVARKMTVETFLGTALLAAQSKDTPLEELLHKVASKKGITAAGLESMRELEVERAMRISFEKAALRNRELAKSE
jgi:pyrroline-5-carboxylate reductase